jgi:saccharopine dehydrogenase-like NADP-dependent oxidoreductase
MRILALGGAGDMGRMSVAILLESPKVEEITIADINIDLAQTFVDLVKKPNLSAVKADINQEGELIDLMASYDLIMSSVGPYYKFGIPILKAALKAQKNIIDICDDWKPTLDALKMHYNFIDANLTAVIGFGASPGITNLMAAYAASKLDVVDEIITAWGECAVPKAGTKPKYYIEPKKLIKKIKLGKGAMGGTISSESGNAAVIHLLYETLEMIPTFKDGKMVNVEPLTETERFSIPGYKDMYACHIGHPEPVTLPRTINAKTISNVMYIGETATEILRGYREKLRNNEISMVDASNALTEEYEKLNKRARMGRAPLKEYLGGPPTLSAVAMGISNGAQKKISVALEHEPYGTMAGVTGVPLAIGALMMSEGVINKKGVLTPEEAVSDPMDFFNRLAPYCGKNLSGSEILVIKEE